MLTYPTPSIASILATPIDRQSLAIFVSGSNFFPASQVTVNGALRTTHYSSQQLLLADPTPADFAQAGELTVAVFDDAVERPTVVFQDQLQPDALLFVGKDASNLYGTTLHQIPATFYKFAISGTGITQTQALTNYAAASPGGGQLDSDGTSIYVSTGQVIDPSSLVISSTFPNIPLSAGLRVDAPASRAYFAGSRFPDFPSFIFSNATIEAFDLSNQQRLGTIPMNEGSLSMPQVFRWGTNGLAIANPAQILLLRSSLTGPIAGPQFTVASLAPGTVLAGGPDLALKISGTGFAAGDTVTATTTTLQSTVVSPTEIDATVPASLLTATGSVQIAITTPANKTAYLVLVIAPGAPVASVTPNFLSFDPLLVGSKSAPQNVTVSNTGTSPLHVSNVTITGDYSQTNNCTTVAPAANCTIAVVFQPTAPNPREGLLTITDDDASAQQTVGLNGTGTDVQVTPGSTGSTAAVTAGQSANYSLTITPQGVTGAVTFSCTNLPKYAACNITPPSATLSSAPVNVNVTITTSQTQTASLATLLTAVSASISWIGLLLVASLWPLRRALRQSRSAATTMLIMISLCAANLIFAGCGGGSSSGGTTPPPPQSTTLTTPQGTYTVNFVVTAQSGSGTMPLTLTVQ